MFKSVFRVVAIGITITSLLISCTACNTSPDTVTELNQTINDASLKITALEIRTVEIPELNEREEVAVLVKFKIENSSSKEKYSLVYDITADGAVTSGATWWYDALTGSEKMLGDVPPAKYAEGFLGADVPKDAKKIEFSFRYPWIGAWYRYATFSFDIPPVEKEADSEA